MDTTQVDLLIHQMEDADPADAADLAEAAAAVLGAALEGDGGSEDAS